MNTRNTMEFTITQGRFDLEHILEAVETYYIEGKLNAADREALIAMAREKAQAPVVAQDEIPRLWEEINAIKARLADLEGGGADGGNDGEWPEYVQPTGAHDAYYSGDRVTFGGRRYLCVSSGACVWDPDVMPGAWEAQEDV